MDTEVRRFFEEYAENYDAFDALAIASYVHLPLLVIEGGQTRIHADVGDAEAFFVGLLEWFRKIDHETAYVAGLDFRPLGQNCVFANVTWGSRRHGSQPDLQWPTAYHLVKPDGE